MVLRRSTVGAAAALVLAASVRIVGCRDASPEPPPMAKPGPSASGTAALARDDSSADAAEPPPTGGAHEKVTHEDKAMGTHLQFTAYTTKKVDAAAVKKAFVAAVDEVRRLEALMTTWKDDSEISRVNAAAGKEAVKVSPETLEVVEKSIWMSGRSEGVFDISFEAMHGLWKFDQDLEETIPSAADIEAKRKLIDWKSIQADHAASTIKLARPGMRISLGGIAKGYAVDMAAKVLEKAGIKAFFVQAGGDLLVRGKKPDGPFRVGVRDPRDPSGGYFAFLPVEDHAFSTAGDYERGFVKDGKRYHHIIDPRTGYPATASRSVTVWAKDAFTADALDDAVFILGPDKGLALIEATEDAGCVIVDAKNQVIVSKRLEGKLRITHPPTDGI